jgi:transporter family-2 protein
MKLPLYAFTIFLGVLLAVPLTMNGKVGSVLNNARVGKALFWCIGAAGAVGTGLTGWTVGALKPLGQVNPVLLTAGAIGAWLVLAIAWLIPGVGAAPVMLMLLAGQILGGMLISPFGWLGSPVHRVSVTNLVGALVMSGGCWQPTAPLSKKPIR